MGEEEGVQPHPLVPVFAAFQREQLPLSVRLPEPVVHCTVWTEKGTLLIVSDFISTGRDIII